MKKYLVPAIGVAAFIIGGFIARANALEAVEILEDTFSKKPVSPPPPAVNPAIQIN